MVYVANLRDFEIAKSKLTYSVWLFIPVSAGQNRRWHFMMMEFSSVTPIKWPQQIFPPDRPALAVDIFSSILIFRYAMPVRRHLEYHWLSGLYITGYFRLPF
jgi:hypothetical protein